MRQALFAHLAIPLLLALAVAGAIAFQPETPAVIGQPRWRIVGEVRERDTGKILSQTVMYGRKWEYGPVMVCRSKITDRGTYLTTCKTEVWFGEVIEVRRAWANRERA